MFNKNLLSVSCAAALLAPALSQAASITLYGVVDEAISYRNSVTKVTGLSEHYKKTQNLIALESGKLMASRWGIKGVEELGGNLKVGFVLENGFSADNGSTGYGGRMFGRESQLYISGDLGTLALGRVGPFTSGNGSYNMLAQMAPYGNQIDNYMAGTNSVMSYVGSRIDDSVTYISPSFNGFSFRGQWSGNVDNPNGGVQNKPSVTRYGTIAAMYKGGPLYLGLIGDVTLYGHKPGKRPSNGNTVTLGGHYDFQSFKLYGAGQYFRNVKNSTFSAGPIKTFQTTLNDADSSYSKDNIAYVKGFGLTTGFDIPSGAFTYKFVVAYMHASSDKDKNDYKEKLKFDRFAATVGFNYSLSKRSTLYTALGYQNDRAKLHSDLKVKQSDIHALLGLCHRF